MQSLLAAGPDGLRTTAAAVEWHQQNGSETSNFDLTDVRLLAPLPNPGKLMYLAGNYADHILEGGGIFPGKDKMTSHFFMKPTTAVIGPDAAIRIPSSTKFADWELELAVVIGQAGRGFSVEEAQSAIVGYTIFNDISARELSFRDNPAHAGRERLLRLAGRQVARHLRSHGTLDHHSRRNHCSLGSPNAAVPER